VLARNGYSPKKKQEKRKPNVTPAIDYRTPRDITLIYKEARSVDQSAVNFVAARGSDEEATTSLAPKRPGRHFVAFG
jgi:hypothetical protein